MEYKYDELKKKTVAQLREIAAALDHEAVKGYTQLNKEHLLTALCTALGIKKGHKKVSKGLNKATIKIKIKALKQKREEAEANKDKAEHKSILRKIHLLKRKLRSA